MTEYEIVISDPFEYDGPNPIFVTGKGVVYGPQIPNWQISDFMLEVKKPFIYQNEEIKYLLVSPRHASFTIDDVQNKTCSVGIGRLLPGRSIRVGSKYNQNDVKYWALGSIKPHH